jgi:hypothetical protein
MRDPYPDTNPSLPPVFGHGAGGVRVVGRPSDAAFGSEVLLVRSGMGGRHRDNKSHSVDGRDQPTTQCLRETDAGLGGG